MTFSYALWLAATGDDSWDSFRERTTHAPGARSRTTANTVAHQALIAGVQSGDAACFDQLVTTYWRALCVFADGYVKDSEIAQELVADVFAALWERRATWRVEATIETYLFGSVRNRARSAHRDRTRRAELLRDATAAGDLDDVVSRSVSPDARLDDDDRVVRLRTAVDALPLRLREATLLRWYQQMEYTDMAHVLAISPTAARQLVSRALRVLREMLAG